MHIHEKIVLTEVQIMSESHNRDIGYKHYSMPEGLSPKEYLDYIEEKRYRWEHEEDGLPLSRFDRIYDPACRDDRGYPKFTREEYRYMLNELMKEHPLIDLSYIPESEWGENQHELMKYIISDIDLASSDDLYRKILDYTDAVHELFDDLHYPR